MILLSAEQSQAGLTHWGRVTQIYVSRVAVIGSDNGLSPGCRQAIICTNAVILLIRILRTNFRAILREIHTFSFKKMHLKMSSGRWQPFCLGLNMLTINLYYHYYCIIITVAAHLKCCHWPTWSQEQVLSRVEVLHEHGNVTWQKVAVLNHLQI